MTEASEPRPILVAVPSRDGSAQLRSIEAFHYVGLATRRPVIFLMTEASNVPRARNGIHEALLQMGVSAATKIWWLDSDILFDGSAAPHLQAMMEEGDRRGRQVLVAAHYRMITGEWQGLVHRDQGQHVVPEALHAAETARTLGVEPRDVPAFRRMPKAATGFGLVYGATDPSYMWRADALGEDIHWWRDHPRAEVLWYERWWPLHKKVVAV